MDSTASRSAEFVAEANALKVWTADELARVYRRKGHRAKRRIYRLGLRFFGGGRQRSVGLFHLNSTL
jgi:hypothetical protein